MPVDFTFSCPLANGIHARPASLLMDVASTFQCQVTLANGRNGREGNAKSVLSMVSADFRHGDPCRLILDGPDEDLARVALAAFLTGDFARCDDALPPTPTDTTSPLSLPHCLQGSAFDAIPGTPVVPGIARGHLLRLAQSTALCLPANLTVGSPDIEKAKLARGIQELLSSYDQQILLLSHGPGADILDAHRAITRDPEFTHALFHTASTSGISAARAIIDTSARFAGMLRASDSVLLRERAADVEDICGQLLAHIYGESCLCKMPELTRDTILAAGELTPSQFLSLDRRFLKGLALSHTGASSHTAILARSFAIPTLAGLPNLPSHSAGEAVLDATLGLLATRLDDQARRYYAMEATRLARRLSAIAATAGKPGATADGTPLEIAATITAAAETGPAIANGAEGIGLFRTEMLFLDRATPPTEDEQFHHYRQVLEAAAGRTAIIRTLDVGGDKPLPFLAIPPEPNPFLGRRGVRIYPQFETIFRTQIRALARASASGPLKVLIPMVSSVEEMEWARGIIAAEQENLRQSNIPHDPGMAVGAMLEVPAAALAVHRLCACADFFSLGTNDLLQYFTAADRGNAGVANVANDLHPAFWQLLRQTVDTAHAHGRWIGLCGELGGKPARLPLLAGLGLDEIAMAAPLVPECKSALALLHASSCRQLLDDVIGSPSATAATTVLTSFSPHTSRPLLDASLIDLDTDASSKAEAIKAACDLLFINGRTTRPDAVEDAIWLREQSYSTGFGFGFAIPHCKSDAVAANTLALVRLRHPVAWRSLDGEPVRLVLLLAIREANQAENHMRALSRLARAVMHEDFRHQLLSEPDPAKVAALLLQTLA